MTENSDLLWLEKQLSSQKTLIPKDTNPFYIIAPPYTRLSAGIKVLHCLCHYLNMLGEDAYIIPYPLELVSDPRWPYFCSFPANEWRNPRLNVKILTQDIIDYHFDKGLTPICVAPEVYDNPFNAPFVARYILNYPGLIAPKYKSPQQFTVSYSKRIADYVGSPYVLHIPTVDMTFFHENQDVKKDGSSFYAGKYRSDFGCVPRNLPDGCIEILRSDQMSTEEVRAILWSSEYFYCFEDTALAIEAVLCGCTVVFMPNKYLKDGTISSYELGNCGFAWGFDSEQIKIAEMTKSRMRENMEELYRKVPGAIRDLAAILKDEVENVRYEKKILLPYVGKTVFFHPDAMIDNSVHEEVYIPEETSTSSHLSDEEEYSTGINELKTDEPVIQSVFSFTRRIKRLIKHILGDWLFSPILKQFVKKIWLSIKKRG